MAYGDPYYQSANGQIDESKKGLLEAVAKGGSAGKAAYDAAQAAVTQSKQEAVARAAQRAALFGAGGNDQTFTGAYDSRLGALQANQAQNDAYLNDVGTAGQSYLEKARASIPVLQAIGANKASAQDAQIKAALDLAKQKAADDAAAAAQKRQDELDKEARADSRAAATAAAKAPKLPKFEDLAGEAQAISDGQERTVPTRSNIGSVPLTDDMLQTAADRAAFNGTDPQIELAKIVGQAGYNLTPAQINSIVTPSKTNTYVKAITPPPPADAKALASKYARYNVDTKTATSILGNQDYKDAVSWLLGGADGKSREEVDSILKANFLAGGKDRTYQILAGEYLPYVPTASQLVSSSKAQQTLGG